MDAKFFGIAIVTTTIWNRGPIREVYTAISGNKGVRICAQR